MDLLKERKMRGFLLVELLNAFTTQELKGFTHFVACPYFNTDQFAIKLLACLNKKVIHKNEFTETLQIWIYCKVFSEKEKPTKQLNTKQKNFLAAKMNILLRLAETFLCNESLKDNTSCRNELLLNNLNIKNQTQLFKRVITKEKKRLDDISNKDFNDYLNEFSIEAAQLNYLRGGNLILSEDNLPEFNKSMDIIYILRKLEVHTLATSISNRVSNKQYDFNVLASLKHLLNIKKYANHPLILLHLICIELQTKNNEHIYINLMNELDKYDQFISKNALDGFYIIASNFCVKQIVKGKRKYYEYLFSVYKKRDEKDLLKNNNNINIDTIKNIVSLGCKVEAYDWANQMIEKYIPFVKKELRDSVYHFHLGTIAFYKDNFDKALYHFIRVDKLNLAYKINCKMMILKSHYLLDKDYDERTFRIFLIAERFIKNQKELGGNDKKAFKNFVRILINIYKFKHKAGKMDKDSINTKLNKMEFVSDKKWLLDMMEKLPNK